uniref:Bestrophin homolog n=1 Tax=Corethron hystrix TaxID=216773 RepID=A0A7S1BBL0_9STRA|mmetsp:Transcript_19099/g.43476  ORF Transcript_19099/g.43476 Transcript_19099/m.43476 type:complete len:268 (+) Transcript_19099:632-1435(+)
MLPQTNDEESLNLRKTMLRWVLLGYELAILKARDQIDTHAGRLHVNQLGLLDGNEWEKMVDGDRHTTVWWWIQAKACQLHSQEVILVQDKKHLSDQIALMRKMANDLMSRIDRDLPIPYSTIVGLLVTLNLASLSVSHGIHLAILNYNSDGSSWKMYSTYVEIIGHFLYNVLFALLFDISQILYNPFGTRSIDVPHEAVSAGIRKLAREVSKCDFPSSMNSIYQIEKEGKDVWDSEHSIVIPKKSRRTSLSLPAAVHNIRRLSGHWG